MIEDLGEIKNKADGINGYVQRFALETAQSIYQYPRAMNWHLRASCTKMIDDFKATQIVDLSLSYDILDGASYGGHLILSLTDPGKLTLKISANDCPDHQGADQLTDRPAYLKIYPLDNKLYQADTIKGEQ